ncbi:MAG TPA: fibronectin type III domain-containing protein [Candidatus Angelobacter sp.]|nr:fibronectin type III domain-containing protein [Candidatus Angelobacter sp.]
MRPYTRTTATCCGATIFARFLICSILVLFVAGMANAQTVINPPTTTIQYGGIPNPGNIVSDFTTPRGGVVLYGTAISAFTGKPVRHLWVGDNIHGICRTDPEIDDPNFHSIDLTSCIFKLNGASVTGGPMVVDSTLRACSPDGTPQLCNFLYLSDVRNSEGVFRLSYWPAGDNGQGFLDFTNIFAMAGNPTGARFQGGQTGCQFPLNTTLAAPPPTGAGDFVALDPQGDLWVSFKKSGAIMRINNPAGATSTGFGSCNDFIQLVATTPDNKGSNGLAWLGHNLWGLDGTGPFVIVNADSTCQALGTTSTTAPTCADDATQLAAAAGAATMDSDQTYPALNGDNLYFGLGVPGNTIWASNVTGGAAVQTIDPAIINVAQLIAAFPAFPIPLGNVGGMVVDRTDPANLMVFSGEDFSTTGVLGAGRWFETCQGVPPAAGAFNCPTPLASAAPNTPTVARAAANATSIQVSWTPAQAAQPVVFYTVRNTFASNGILLPDTFVLPGPSGFPPTTTTISAGLVPTASYAFSVAASNGIGTSAFSGQSNTEPFPRIIKPGIPTNVQAFAANAAALVTWVPPANPGGAPIVSYTVTAIANNVVTAITTTVGVSPSNSAVIAGLTNGTSYTFSVHADNAPGAGHSSMESTPSNPVIPTASPVLVVTETGPLSFTVTPTQLTYSISITNTSILAVTGATVNDVLTTGDGAFILLGQPSQGTCNAGGIGVTNLTCNLGTIAAGSKVTLNVIVQVVGLGVTNTANVSALDNAAVLQTGSAAVNTVPPPPPVNSVTAAVSVTGNAQVPNPNTGQAGNIVWTISDVTQTRADHVVFTNVIPAGLILNTITFAENNPTNGVLTCSYTPTGGLTIACPAGAIGSNVGATIQVFAEPGLGGSTKNGAKPPQTLIVTPNVTAPNTHGAVFHPSGTVTFGPGGTDTLPNSASVTITVR